jgi:hypothetical protein
MKINFNHIVIKIYSSSEVQFEDSSTLDLHSRHTYEDRLLKHVPFEQW